MNEPAIRLVKDEQELLTIEQMAEREGITNDGMRKRLEKAGISPVVGSKRISMGREASLYDYTKIHQYFSMRSVESLTLDETLLATSNMLEPMSPDDVMRFALQVMKYSLDKKDAEVRSMRERLDLTDTHYSVKRVMKELQLDEEPNWRPVKKYCLAHGLPILRADDMNYGEVNVYPVEAWHEVYGYEL